MLKSKLNGVRVLVTRPVHQAEKLCRMVTEQGGTAVPFPLIQIQASDNQEMISGTLNNLQYFDWVIFTSANAVNFALQANSGKIPVINSLRLAAIGAATAAALQKAGLAVDLLPERGYNSEALLETAAFKRIKGQRMLIVRGQGGRTLLAETLSERGAVVEHLAVYIRSKPTVTEAEILAMAANDSFNVITITSVAALNNLIDLLGKKIKNTMLLMPLVVISDRIKKAAEQIGFTKIAVSAKPSDTEIINTVIALMNGE